MSGSIALRFVPFNKLHLATPRQVLDIFCPSVLAGDNMIKMEQENGKCRSRERLYSQRKLARCRTPWRPAAFIKPIGFVGAEPGPAGWRRSSRTERMSRARHAPPASVRLHPHLPANSSIRACSLASARRFKSSASPPPRMQRLQQLIHHLPFGSGSAHGDRIPRTIWCVKSLGSIR